MSPQLCELVYCSRKTTATTEPGDHEILDILAAARRNNERDGITGAMLFNNGYFAQLLEGPTDAVNHRFAKIRTDPRHHDVLLLSQIAVTGRAYPDWAMGFVTTGDETVIANVFGRAFADDRSAVTEIRKILQQSTMMTQVWGDVVPTSAG